MLSTINKNKQYSGATSSAVYNPWGEAPMELFVLPRYGSQFCDGKKKKKNRKKKRKKKKEKMRQKQGGGR
jgi:hypothetical protein